MSLWQFVAPATSFRGHLAEKENIRLDYRSAGAQSMLRGCQSLHRISLGRVRAEHRQTCKESRAAFRRQKSCYGTLIQYGFLKARKWCQQQGPWSTTLLVFCAISPVSQPSPLGSHAEASTEQTQGRKSRPSWGRILNLKTNRGAAKSEAGSKEPQTIADVTNIVAANVPVFFFHNQEKYFPCTVDWFLERSRLVKVAKGWQRRVLEVLVDFGMLDGGTLALQQQEFDAEDARKRKRQFLQLQLQETARGGQPEHLDKIPIYAHVKQTVDPILGKRDGIEINYMKFLAYNGPYKLFHSLWIGPLGAHDADWEHVTVRLTPDGRNVTGVYYSAHRHRDGAWRSADEVPRSLDGRPHAYVAENGHGSYPVAGTILRLFLVINDYTSSDGKKWNPEKVVLVTQNEQDRLPSVVSRGSSLNGTTYLSPSSTHGAKLHTKVERQEAPWLKYQGKWGSSVEAPQRQEWFARAENPVSRTWLQQIFFPLLPGVESIWEPAKEEIQEALQNLQEGMDEGMEAFKDAAEDVQQEFDRSRKLAYKRWRELMKSLEKGSDK